MSKWGYRVGLIASFTAMVFFACNTITTVWAWFIHGGQGSPWFVWLDVLTIMMLGFSCALGCLVYQIRCHRLESEANSE